ncbi:MAG TPA: ATP-binding protein [Myxococcus sp.]|nr:ATP-binding protein [Myxococcus sp.]
MVGTHCDTQGDPDGTSRQAPAVTARTLAELRRITDADRRLEALRRTALLDSPTEEAFDRLARLTTRTLGVPVALVSLVDKDRQFFKSCVGLPAPWCDSRQTPLTYSFCIHVVATGQPLVINDARIHPLRENLAVDRLGVVAYAGFPLTTSEGDTLGTLCAIDIKPRAWTNEDLAILADLAASVMTEIELRATHELEAQTRAAVAARAEAEAARQRFALLAELSGVLAEHTHLAQALTVAVRLVVPTVADGCVIDLIQEGGPPQRVAVAHVNPREEQRLRDVAESTLPASSPVSGHARMGNAGGASFGLALVGRERDLGAITFTTVSPRRLGSIEVDLARDVARRVSLAVDNAQLHQELVDAIRSRDRFLSVASHELRTPLTALRLQSQSLLRGAWDGQPCDAGQVAAKAGVIARQVERLGHLVDELLDIARVREGRMSYHLEDLDLVAMVQEVATRFREELAKSGNTLVLRCDGGVHGWWDPLRLEQVLTNLLSNAIKYGRGRPITVTVEENGGLARIIVRDEGIGIAQGDQARIFERFERAVSEQHYGGLGLGLWIVREILRGMGGTISVRSTPGVGSAFTVELPCQPAHEAAPVLH